MAEMTTRAWKYGNCCALATAALSLALTACGDSGSGKSEAQLSDVGTPGLTIDQTAATSIDIASKPPFFSSVQLTGRSLSVAKTISFTIAPMPGTLSAPVHVSWTLAALIAHGYYQGGTLSMPIFGLYVDYANQVNVDIAFEDGSVQQIPFTIKTAPYTDPNGVYDQATILQARQPGSTLTYSFMMFKSTVSSPAIIDTDGKLRWEASGVVSAESSILLGGSFLIGSQTSNLIYKLQWDGTQTNSTTIDNPNLTEFTHNIDPGKVGLLAEFSGQNALGNDGGAIVAEIFPQGASNASGSGPQIVKIWDMAEIIYNYMQSQGDNGAAFVRPNADWFHLNAAAYDPSDDSVIASSRENFVIKVDYSTGNIIWIFGDPTKYWYTFPSLRAKALTLQAGGLYPVGQHGISVTPDGLLLLFNDGAGSDNQPAGEPAGITRTFSAVNSYAIDKTGMIARQVMDFEYNQSIFASFCGSVYQYAGSYLVDYSTADNFVHDRIVGLDSNQNVAFDFQYNSSTPCGTSWNAIPVPLENLQITD
jgi:hypothetical protein